MTALFKTRETLENSIDINNHIVFSYDLVEGQAFKNFRAYNRLDENHMELMDMVLENDNHLYEIIYPERNIKPYFDLEIEIEENKHKELGMLFINCVIDYILNKFNFQLDMDDFLVLDSCRTGKLSYHLIINNKIYFRSMTDHKIFIEEFFKHLQNTQTTLIWGDKKEKTIMDKLVYGTAQNFRCVNQSKKGKKHILKNIMGLPVKEYFITLYDGIGERELINIEKTEPVEKKINIIELEDQLPSEEIKEDKFTQLLFDVIKNDKYENGNRVISRAFWFQICGILKTNNYHMKTWLKWSKLASNTDTAEKQWNRLNSKYIMNIYGLQKIAKDINPDGYKLWLGKWNDDDVIINWDLSEAEFAKKFHKICFKNNKVIFTGKGKEPEGFMFNGIYWLELSLHNAELQQAKFDELYKWYCDNLEQEKDEMDKKVYENLSRQIKTLNSHKTRINVIKIFKCDNYIETVEWNKNNNLFVFEDCVYDLELGKIQDKPNELDYNNISCGKKYNMEFKKEDVNDAEKVIESFIADITKKEDCEYLLKQMASFLKQENTEEKGYFWLGRGRNGKGTTTELLKNAIGKYWGELSMDYYTTYSKDADRPNQNLYNCRKSRVLNSSEISDADGNNKDVKFVSSQFKSITGGDAVYARELGTKNTAYFKAGKVLIQTNKMPIFSKIDTSLRERIVVMNFPYTYTDDPVLLEKEPSKYKLKDITFKAKFSSDLYRIAMLNILFKNYKEYKKSFIIPESVKIYTQSYFAGQSIKSWIDDNCDEKPKGSIGLETIKQMYNSDTGKNMSVKQIKDELIELEFILKKGDNGFKLKNYILKIVENDDN